MKTKLYLSFPFRRALNSLMLVVFLMLGGLVNGQTFSIFNNVDPFPATDPSANNYDGTSVTTSVKFRVLQAGVISSIRFFKGNTSTGPHVGTLWVRNADSVTNTILAQETFVGETADGWQQQTFSAPIPVVPGALYTATIYHDDGVYSAVSFGDPLAWDPYDNSIVGPFIMLMGSNDDPGIPFTNDDPDPAGLGNGTYLYTNDPNSYPNQGFPNGGSFNSSNYFVDLVYTSTFLLPVTFTDFKAVEKNYDVNLSWQTATEQNNLGFEVQRSANGTNYEVLSFVDGAGESSSKKSYAYTDRNLEPGMYYYRLKQIDRDGRSKYSPIVTANVKRASTLVLYQNFPNPVKDQATIQYVLPRHMPVTLTLIDLNGRLIRVLDQGMRATGQHSITVDASGLMKGTYLYRLETEGEAAEVRKMVVQ